jgi:hypothetical protein
MNGHEETAAAGKLAVAVRRDGEDRLLIAAAVDVDVAGESLRRAWRPFAR